VLMQFLGSLVRAKVHARDISLMRDAPIQSPLISRPPRRTRGSGRWIRRLDAASSLG
jgi:hypothetical protein